ncbi:hypothetical protein J8273_1180 [Carpediemonas membranifera]|uniref:Uncharacterized protein n=1 Tax=Carpediemonas membranifera TaxID=201153 RepID=A0A8J6B1G4_9EUKA|nr:hypothetical protein J8273_1180 [Carpediemonas membranifera]|eukprot:KAG9397265.1 hypothetical protein J8273_1180 [Carpediemonas membranifera]
MAHFKADDFVVEQLDTPKIECLVDLIKAVGPTLDQMRIADERDSHTLTQLKKEGEKLNALTRKADEEALKNQDSKGKRRSEGASDELKRQLKVVSERFFHGKECNARQVAEKVAKYSAVVRNNAEREKKWQDMWVDMQTLVDTCKEWEKEAHRPVRARYLIQDLFTIRDGNWAALQATKALSKQEAKQERESIQRDRLSQARSRSRASARSSLSRASTRTATADTGMWTPSRSHSKGSNRTTPATQSSVNARRGLGPKASLFGALMDSQEDLYADLNATIDDGAVGWLNESTSLDDIMGYVEHTVDEAELEDFDAAMVHAHNRMVRAVLDQVGRTKEGKLTVFFRYVREMISLKHVEAGDDDLCEHVAKALAKLVEAGSVKNQEIAQALAEFAYRTLKLKATIFIELIRANTPNALAFIAGVLAKTVVDEEDEDEVNLEDTANWLTAVNLREFTHVNEAQLAETIDAKAPGLFAQISASRLASAIARGDKNLGDLPTANPARSQTAMAALFTIKRRKMAPNPTPAEALKKLKALCGEVDLTAAEVARVHQEFQTPDTAIEDTFAEYIAVGGDVQAVKEWATGMMSRPLPRFKAQGKAVMEMVEKQ